MKKISSNEINEVLEEKEGPYDKSLNSKSEEFKDNIEKRHRNAVVEYEMKRGKKGKLWAHSQNQLKNIVIGWI